MHQEKETNFKEIFTLNERDLIDWCLNSKLLKEPNCCKACRKNGARIKMRLSANTRLVMSGVVNAGKWKTLKQEIFCLRNSAKLSYEFY